MIIIYAEIYLTNIKSLQKQNPRKRKSKPRLKKKKIYLTNIKPLQKFICILTITVGIRGAIHIL